MKVLVTNEIPSPAYQSEYFLPGQVKDILGWGNVRTVSTRAKPLAWRRVMVTPSTYAYHREDVLGYHHELLRTELLRGLGIHIRGRFQNQTYDFSCPVCRGFAVKVDKTWMCEYGHHGKI